MTISLTVAAQNLRAKIRGTPIILELGALNASAALAAASAAAADASADAAAASAASIGDDVADAQAAAAAADASADAAAASAASIDTDEFVKKDGSTPFEANQPMGSFKLTGLAAGTTAGDSVRFEQAVLVANNLSDVTAATARTNLGLGTGNSPEFTAVNIGAATDTTVSRSSAGVIAVEGVILDSKIQQNSQSAAYPIVLTDANKHILHPAADNNARTFTIPANASVAFPIGTTLTFVNEINVVTIAITTDTLTLSPGGTTGSRSLAANGMATAIKITATKWMISGSGLT